MAANEYRFITRWHVQSTVNEVLTILNDAVALARWWPSVYLDVKVLEPGDETGVGRVVSLYTKGWLPYTLRWQFRIAQVTQNGFTIVATGDLVSVTYNWKIDAEKPLLRKFSFIMKPIFSANHHWAMRKGEESLKLELRRMHAKTAQERASVPPPPGPTFPMFIKRPATGIGQNVPAG
jgi:hypothetical protein